MIRLPEMKAGQELAILEFREPSLSGAASARAFLAAAKACGFKLAGEHAVDDYLDSQCADLGEFNALLALNPERITRRFRVVFESAKVTFITPRGGQEAIDVNEFRRRWEDMDWMKANTDHPIAFMFALLVQLKSVNGALAARKPRIKLVRGSRECFVPQDGDPAKVEELLGYFKNGWTKSEAA